MVRTPCFHCQKPGFDPWLGTKIPQTMWCGPRGKKKSGLKKVNISKNSIIFKLNNSKEEEDLEFGNL